jgi:hypothetical protein
MKKAFIYGFGLVALISQSCSRSETTLSESSKMNQNSVVVDTFADIQVLKYDLQVGRN